MLTSIEACEALSCISLESAIQNLKCVRAAGYDDVADDPSMGWARYAHSMRVFCFNSGLFYIRPTEAASLLLKKVMHRIETESGWDQALFNEVTTLLPCLSKAPQQTLLDPLPYRLKLPHRV